MLILDRAYPPDDRAALGLLSIGEWTCHTLELPWRENKPNKSCIPAGTYTLGLRPSPLIDRITKGEFSEGWEVQHVPNRTFIMFHHGNWVEDTEGCILVGRKAEWTSREGHMVTSSMNTFRDFMAKMEKLPPEQRLLTIRVREPAR